MTISSQRQLNTKKGNSRDVTSQQVNTREIACLESVNTIRSDHPPDAVDGTETNRSILSTKWPKTVKLSVEGSPQSDGAEFVTFADDPPYMFRQEIDAHPTRKEGDFFASPKPRFCSSLASTIRQSHFVSKVYRYLYAHSPTRSPCPVFFVRWDHDPSRADLTSLIIYSTHEACRQILQCLTFIRTIKHHHERFGTEELHLSQPPAAHPRQWPPDADSASAPAAHSCMQAFG